MVDRIARSRGFTLIECLVVITLIAVLLGVLVPAVQAAREAARRARCANNLRQIGLALYSYNDSANCLPIGRMKTYDLRYTGPSPPCSATMVDKSLLVAILPQIEQGNLYNSINLNLTIFGFENRTLFASSVATCLCPSDPDANGLRAMLEPNLIGRGLIDPNQVPGAASTSYQGSFGSFDVIAQPMPGNDCKIPAKSATQANGTLTDLSPIRLHSLRDGAGQTFFAAEKAITLVQGDLNRRTTGWWFSGNLKDSLFTTFYPPNADQVVTAFRDASASSLHPGGLNTLMAEGSVRFIKNSIDTWPFDPTTGQPVDITHQNLLGYWEETPKPGNWQAFSTRAGRDLIDTDDF